MCWGLEPSLVNPNGYRPESPAEPPVISRELLRTVCEPFFEQMLTALQQALQTPNKQQQHSDTQTMQTLSMSKSACLLRPTPRMCTKLDPMLDEESTEAEELGAFASLLSGPNSGPSSEGESIDVTEAKSLENEVLPPPMPPSPKSNEGSEKVNEAERHTMVCRHWKSKGWCRLESKCKFLHPEHKRGVAAHKGCSGGNKTGGISKAANPSISTVLSLADAIDAAEVKVPVASDGIHKQQSGNDVSNKSQAGDPEKEVTRIPLASGGEQQTSRLRWASAV